MLDFDGSLKLSGFIVYVVRCNSGGKSLPLAASPLFCTTCGPQSEHAVCTYHIWHVLSLERSDWSVRKCCGLVFWATDSFLFPRPPNTPLIPLLGLLLHPTQTDTCFLSFLNPLTLLGGIFPSIQLYKHWNWLSTSHDWAAVSTLVFFSRRIQSVWSDRLGTFPRLSACCTNGRCSKSFEFHTHGATWTTAMYSKTSNISFSFAHIWLHCFPAAFIFFNVNVRIILIRW